VTTLGYELTFADGKKMEISGSNPESLKKSAKELKAISMQRIFYNGVKGKLKKI
jgi:hypothetical protein